LWAVDVVLAHSLIHSRAAHTPSTQPHLTFSACGPPVSFSLTAATMDLPQSVGQAGAQIARLSRYLVPLAARRKASGWDPPVESIISLFFSRCLGKGLGAALWRPHEPRFPCGPVVAVVGGQPYPRASGCMPQLPPWSSLWPLRPTPQARPSSAISL
jgi:hypothetical protein